MRGLESKNKKIEKIGAVSKKRFDDRRKFLKISFNAAAICCNDSVCVTWKDSLHYARETLSTDRYGDEVSKELPFCVGVGWC